MANDEFIKDTEVANPIDEVDVSIRNGVETRGKDGNLLWHVDPFLVKIADNDQ